MATKTTMSPVPVSSNGRYLAPISPATQRMLDRTEEDVAAIEELLYLLTDTNNRMRQQTLVDQFALVANVRQKFTEIEDAPDVLKAELMRQLQNHLIWVGTLMDDVQDELQAVFYRHLHTPHPQSSLFDDIVTLLAKRSSHRR